MRSFRFLCCCVAVLIGSSLLAQDRVVEFATSEGTWMSLDVSPDGTTIVFELVGDVYRLPIDGGEAKRILSGGAFQSQPRFSPDGGRLAYVSDESGSDNVWVADATGGGARAISGLPRAQMLSPEWSAEGDAIFVTVVTNEGPAAAEIWRFQLDGDGGEKVVENANGAPARLVSAPAPGAYGPATAPDGRALLYTSVTPRAYGSRDGARSVIMRHDLATGHSAPVVVEGLQAMKPRLSADARLLVYAAETNGRTGLRVRELGSGRERWLALPIQRHQLESRATRDVLPNFAILPDGSAVIAAFGGKIRRLDIATGASTVIPFEAKVSLAAAPRLDFPRRVETGPVVARRFQHLAAGPAGRLAFSTVGRVFVSVPDQAGPRRLTTSARPREYMPTWAPDGTQIAFVTWDEAGGNLWAAPVDGDGEPRRLTETPAYWADPVWSPDGRSLVALYAPLSSARNTGDRLPGDAALVRLEVSSGATTVLAPARGARHPHFANDGRIYLSAREGLISLDADGSGRRLEASLAAGPRRGFGPPGGGPSWRVAPDGSAIAVSGPAGLLRFADPEAAGAELVPENGARMAGSPDTFAWQVDASGLVWITDRGLTLSASDGRVTTTDIDIGVPRARPSGTVILRGGTAVTMSGDEVIQGSDVVVRDDRIVSVGAAGTADASGATVIDVTGKFLVPGFIDVHAHFGTNGDFLEPESSTSFANLAMGVTTVRNPQASPDVFALADIIAADAVPGPRIFSTGPGIFTTANLTSLEQTRDLLVRYRDNYGTHLLKSYLVGNRQQRQWVVEASRELGMMTTTEGGADTKANMTHALDGFSGNEHAFPVAPIYNDMVQLVARTGMTYTPTLVVSFGAALPIYRLLAEERPHENMSVSRWFGEGELYARTSRRGLWFPPEAYSDRQVAAGARAVLEAGGNVALGGHGEVQGLSNHWEMALLAAGGMAPHDVLRVATLEGAEALGYAQDLGSLEAGKLADIVILDRDPLADIRNTETVSQVMKNGVLYDSRTLNQVWPKAESLRIPWRIARDDAAVETRIEETVRQRMRDGRIPGMAVGVVRNGEVMLARGYGVANLEVESPVSPETMFQSGSLGKQFTAAGIMALVEEGRLSLDDSVRMVLTETPDTWQPITIGHLLNHSSGIPDYTSDRFDYARNYSEQDLVRMASELELEFAAGTRWNYSNTGYVMLGVVMGRVAGKPYWEFLRDRIFDPAGMPTIRVNTEAEIVRHRARGYIPTSTGWENAAWVAPRLNTTADGSMMLSLTDLLAWHETVRQRKVLSTSSWDRILQPMTLVSGAEHPYGFAWFLDDVNGAPLYHHSGTWQGFTTQYSYYPNDDLGIVILANARSVSAITVAGEIAQLVDSALTPPSPPAEPIPDPDSATTNYVSSMLTKAASPGLDLSDFAFVRQTLFPRIRAGLQRALDGLGAPDRLDLLERRTVGDDTALQYWAWYGDRRFRVIVSVGPDGGLTALRAVEQ